MSPSRMLAVIDLSSVEAWPSGSAIPAELSLLIPDAMLKELAGRHQSTRSRDRQGSPDGLAVKIGSFFEANSHRLWLGHFWEDLSRGEFDPLVNTRIEHVINKQVSPAAQGPTFPATEWPRITREMVQERWGDTYENGRREFLELCGDFAQNVLRSARPVVNAMKNDLAVQHEWIRRPEQMRWALAIKPDKYATPSWNCALLRFPDRLAHGRWLRLIMWYALQRALAPEQLERTFENNYDDAHYAFLASYSKLLVTGDSGLERAVRAVSPAVRVWNTAKCGFVTPAFS